MNEKEKNSVLILKDEQGKMIECEIIYTFTSEQTKKDYVIYTDNTTDEAGSLMVYANVYDRTGSSKELLPIETEEEWNTIESILNKLEEEE